jgi:hypothetical protein
VAATADEIMRLRRMTGEVSNSTYYDSVLSEYIEAYPLNDARGEEPYEWDTTTEPPTRDDNDEWVPTYDLNAAAARIWEEKATEYIADYDYSADGASLNRSQAFKHMMAQAGYYRSKRAMTTTTQYMDIADTQDDWVANAPEEDD